MGIEELECLVTSARSVSFKNSVEEMFPEVNHCMDDSCPQTLQLLLTKIINNFGRVGTTLLSYLT